MNTSGCPSGRFTDEILVFPGFVQPCEGLVGVWLGMTVSLLVARTLLLVPMLRARQSRTFRKQQQQEGQRRRTRVWGCRLPLFLITQVCTILSQAIFVLVTSLDAGDTVNGISTLLCGIHFMFLGVTHMFMARSVVVLGRRIIPLSMKKVKEGQETLNGLNRIDMVLKIFGAMTIMCIFLVVIFFVLGAALGGNQLWTFQAAFFSVAIYELCIAIALVYQFQRCITAVYKLKFDSSGAKDGAEADDTADQQTPKPRPERHAQQDAIHVVIRTMRIQQLTTLASSLSLATVAILIATFTIVLHYWVYCVAFMLSDCSSQAMLLFASVLAGRKRDRQSKQVASARMANRLDDTRPAMSSNQIVNSVGGSVA